MPVASKRLPQSRPHDEDDELVDAEVPAAVVCARCGNAECSGCAQDGTLSGVIAVVPWERPGGANLGRLWATARATTFDADRFFESLPDGPLAPAVKFAVVSEMMAVTAMALSALVLAIAVAPARVRHIVMDHGVTALRLTAVGIPAIAALLVVAHAAHGYALDRGARRAGSRSCVVRALRFGLYAAGWDIVLGPIGLVGVAVKEGLRRAASIATVGVGLPTRSAVAFLRGCYRLEGKGALPALRASYLVAIMATLLGALVVVAGLVAALAL
ncbi:MAG TPA: hypothetical protein VEK07_21690 [Polyangiaceae bacterium]|nr:hypothetical protein [Polyangiaceae bacterium]